MTLEEFVAILSDEYAIQIPPMRCGMARPGKTIQT